MVDAQCGDRLRQERDRLNLSQQGLADRIGIQRAMLSRYERGAAEPGASVLMKLASAGIEVHLVLFGSPNPPSATAVPSDAAAYKPISIPTALRVAEPTPPEWGRQRTKQREVTYEEATLLDNYAAADESGRAAARSVLDALAKRSQADQ